MVLLIYAMKIPEKMVSVTTNTSSSVPMIRPAFRQPFFCWGVILRTRSCASCCTRRAPSFASVSMCRALCRMRPIKSGDDDRLRLFSLKTGHLPFSLMFLLWLCTVSGMFAYRPSIRDILPYLSTAKKEIFC